MKKNWQKMSLLLTIITVATLQAEQEYQTSSVDGELPYIAQRGNKDSESIHAVKDSNREYQTSPQTVEPNKNIPRIQTHDDELLNTIQK